MESHTFVAMRGELARTLEDVLNIMALPQYSEANAMSSTLAGEGKDKQHRLIETASSTKSSYVSWIS